MRPTVRFAQVLDDKLAEDAVRPAGRPPAQRSSWMPPPGPPPLFADDIPFRCGRIDWVAGAYGRPVSAARPHPTRPAARRSATERAALDCLRGFGASLDEACSDEEVKSAFRSLALRFHPDRHPHVAPADRAYLAGAFGRITEAYRMLLPRPH